MRRQEDRLIRRRRIHDAPTVGQGKRAGYSLLKVKVGAVHRLRRNRRGQRDIHCREALVDVKLTRLPVCADASPVIEPKCRITRLLHLGKQYAGSVSGAMNTFGNLGGFCCSLMFGYLLSSTGNYNLPLYLIAVMLVISAIFFAFINPSKPIGE